MPVMLLWRSLRMVHLLRRFVGSGTQLPGEQHLLFFPPLLLCFKVEEELSSQHTQAQATPVAEGLKL
jgi:hypothetical protein